MSEHTANVKGGETSDYYMSIEDCLAHIQAMPIEEGAQLVRWAGNFLENHNYHGCPDEAFTPETEKMISIEMKNAYDRLCSLFHTYSVSSECDECLKILARGYSIISEERGKNADPENRTQLRYKIFKLLNDYPAITKEHREIHYGISNELSVIRSFIEGAINIQSNPKFVKVEKCFNKLEAWLKAGNRLNLGLCL